MLRKCKITAWFSNRILIIRLRDLTIYSKNNENVTCLRILRKKSVTYENLRKTYEYKI
jgi:hypothetical protein